MSTIAIYRHQLFKRSESFIHAQASNVPRHQMLYVGRTLTGEAPANVSYVVASPARDKGSWRTIRHTLTRNPASYVQLLKDHRIGLIHAHFGIEGVYAQKIAERLDVPFVTTFHGFDASLSRAALLKSGKPAMINYALHRRTLAARGALFICVSEFVRNAVVRLGFPPARTVVHYIGVDTTAIQHSHSRSRTPVVLHVARLVEKKGTKDLLNAFAETLKSVPDAELVIVGEGPLGAALRQLAKALVIDSSVRFMGALPNRTVLDLMAGAWVLCVPSVTASSGDSEGLPIVVLEAAASGLPVVATRHGGLPEGVKDGITGLLHDESDVYGLSASLTHLLRNEQSRSEMGLNARNHVSEKFNLHTQSGILADIYDSIR